jgi:hypothetical protein
MGQQGKIFVVGNMLLCLISYFSKFNGNDFYRLKKNK